MTIEEIIENNKLIAEFMESSLYYYKKENCTCIEGFEYHKSWDWLMPVVSRIEEQVHKFTIETYLILIEIRKDIASKEDFIVIPPGNRSIEARLDAVYQAVVKFIKWYNEANNV